MSDGWKCPGCGRCYAPTMEQCPVCISVPHMPSPVYRDNPDRLPKCGCPVGSICNNTACPHAVKVMC